MNFFLDRGHTDITVFVPSWRKEQPRPDVPITGKKRFDSTFTIQLLIAVGSKIIISFAIKQGTMD